MKVTVAATLVCVLTACLQLACCVHNTTFPQAAQPAAQSGRFFVIEHYGKTFVKAGPDRGWEDTSNLLEAMKFNTRDEADTWIRTHTYIWVEKGTGQQSPASGGKNWAVMPDTLNFKVRAMEETVRVLPSLTPDRP